MVGWSSEDHSQINESGQGQRVCQGLGCGQELGGGQGQRYSQGLKCDQRLGSDQGH